MALTELKSDLSKFRRPIERPIIENQSFEINRKSNLTPISNLSTGITSPAHLKETPTKSVVTPKPFDTTEKFKGQTTPNNFEFSPEFTTPKLSNVDFFPNTNADGFTARMRESRFNFSSLSSPTPMTLEGKFLGETDPNRLSLESKFLGQTTPTPVDNTEKFKGQTTPNEVDDTEKFKGQTTPTNFAFTPQFTATTPTNFTFTPQFTTPNLGNVDFIPNIDAKGFTSKIKQVPSQFVDINRDQSIFTERTLNSKLGLVNFFSNDDASGFTKNFVDKTNSQFTGISGETFTSPKVTFGGDFGLSFLPGNKIKLEGSAAKYYGTGNQKWQPGGKRYEDNYVSIGDLLIRENSPSYLTKVYGQFNLQDDSFNPYPLFFRQPFILRGIQRKNKKEPQKWGLGLSIDSIMGIDLIRGGVVTSTERALVDVARIGQFILSPKGLVWSVMQIGMQRTNTYNKVWTPANLLIAVGGQHIGLKPKRHGLLPFDKIDDGNYEIITPLGGDTKYKTKLEGFRKNISVLGRLGSGDSTVLLESQPGGPESVYGIGISTIRTSTNTFSNPEKTYGDNEADYVQKYNPIFENQTKILRNTDKPFEDTYGKEFGVIEYNLGGSLKQSEDLKKLGLLNKIINFNYSFQKIDNFGKSWFENKVGNTNTHFKQNYSSILNQEGNIIEFSFDNINKDTNTYGKSVPTTNDELLKFGVTSQKDTYGNKSIQNLSSNNEDDKLKTVAGEEYLTYNQIREFAGTSITKTSFNDFRTKYKNDGDKIKKLKNNITGYGPNYYTNENIKNRVGLGNSDTTIGISTSGNANLDLIKLSFTTDGVGTIQFRGTVNSISETFTPNWTEIKYSGRAENAYLYDTFGRELNFGFRVYAYSVSELQPMWQRLEKLGKMTMPTYVSSGYRGNITKFTLGTMYQNFPALISSLQYAVPDEFTWEIGLNKGASDNVLPMGVDVTIGLKLLNNTLHNTATTTKIYDFERSKEGVLGTTMEDIQEMNRTAVGTLAL